jgi:hypothetical protein
MKKYNFLFLTAMVMLGSSTLWAENPASYGESVDKDPKAINFDVNSIECVYKGQKISHLPDSSYEQHDYKNFILRYNDNGLSPSSVSVFGHAIEKNGTRYGPLNGVFRYSGSLESLKSKTSKQSISENIKISGLQLQVKEVISEDLTCTFYAQRASAKIVNASEQSINKKQVSERVQKPVKVQTGSVNPSSPNYVGGHPIE